jgi:hypothetical protein
MQASVGHAQEHRTEAVPLGRGFTAWFMRRAVEMHSDTTTRHGVDPQEAIGQLLIGGEALTDPSNQHSPWPEWWDALADRVFLDVPHLPVPHVEYELRRSAAQVAHRVLGRHQLATGIHIYRPQRPTLWRTHG